MITSHPEQMLNPREASPERPDKKARTKTTKTSKDDQSLPDLWLLRDRLRQEGEVELLGKISLCQEPLILKCLQCGDRKEVRQRCKRKWCPGCAKQLAASRSAELEYIVERMRWPLFVTLTMKNVDDLHCSEIRKLRRAFGKLRHRKLWTSRTRGGIAAVEITNIGHGWHPHLHAVIDCQWLAIKTPCIRPRDSHEVIKDKCKSAAQELEAVWAKLLGQPTASVKIKRAYRGQIAKEVVKYTVKNEDLILAQGNIGDLIRALDSCRLMTTFGNCHGQCVSDVRREAKAAAKARLNELRKDDPPPCLCGNADWIGDDYATYTARYDQAKRTGQPLPRFDPR